MVIEMYFQLRIGHYHYHQNVKEGLDSLLSTDYFQMVIEMYFQLKIGHYHQNVNEVHFLQNIETQKVLGNCFLLSTDFQMIIEMYFQQKMEHLVE